MALARTLAPGPSVLLLDEPASWLDRPQREDLFVLLRRLTSDFDATVVHVTHDFSEAAAVADVAALILGGRIRQTGPLPEILRRPSDLAAARFLGITNCFAVDAQDAAGRPLALGHAWTVAGPTPARAGWLMFRPEDVVVSASSAHGENSLDAAVKELIDRADFVHVVAERAGQRIDAHISPAACRQLQLHLGQSVILSVLADACHLIEPSSEGL